MVRATQTAAIFCVVLACLILAVGAFADGALEDQWFWWVVVLVSLAFALFGFKDYAESWDERESRRRAANGERGLERP